jgi:alkylated DNA repair protein (DNA oxidative demethylase)
MTCISALLRVYREPDRALQALGNAGFSDSFANFSNGRVNQTMSATPLDIRGFRIFQGWLDKPRQQALIQVLRPVLKAAPPFRPFTPRGGQMSVRMTSAGRVGWIADQRGYRYEPLHPSGVSWPEIPEPILQIWHAVTGETRQPDCCLINYYGEDARMGMHRDSDEVDFSWPVVSVSLGDDGLFRIGNAARGGRTESIWLQSGDVVVMGGDARLTYHGVDRIRFGSSRLLPKGGRLNLTLRVVG